MGKREVKGMIGSELPEDLRHAVLAYAERKQQCVYEQCHDPAVMQEWYLSVLMEEFIKRTALSEMTMNLCRALRNMEKEHSAKSQSAQLDIHIVTGSAL